MRRGLTGGHEKTPARGVRRKGLVGRVKLAIDDNARVQRLSEWHIDVNNWYVRSVSLDFGNFKMDMLSRFKILNVGLVDGLTILVNKKDEKVVFFSRHIDPSTKMLIS